MAPPRTDPIAGRAVADAAWSRYLAAWEAWEAGTLPITDVVCAGRKYEDAQTDVERAAERESIARRRDKTDRL